MKAVFGTDCIVNGYTPGADGLSARVEAIGGSIAEVSFVCDTVAEPGEGPISGSLSR